MKATLTITAIGDGNVKTEWEVSDDPPDDSVILLMAGNSIIFRGAQYQVTRISTNAIENEISGYAQKEDAIGFVYQQEGHIFYCLTFPTANATWVFDIIQQHWHKRAWMDTSGNLNRWRPNCFAPFNNQLIVGDYENGNLYGLDLDYYLDNGDPIVRIRSFPHLTQENDRMVHRNLIAAMEVGMKWTLQPMTSITRG